MNFKEYYPDFDPKQTYNLTITFVDFYPSIHTINVEYRLGMANPKIKLPPYVKSPSKYKIVSIDAQ